METDKDTFRDQFLSFSLRGEHFAVEISKVREVLDVANLTKIPQMPEYLCGVINLRGTVVPIADLGLKLGMGSVKHTVNTCVMIIEVEIGEEAKSIQMGVVTDSVQEVIDLKHDEIEPVPQMGPNLKTDFLLGIGRREHNFLMLLDINKVLSSEEIANASSFHQSGHESMAEEDAERIDTVEAGME